MGDQCRTFGDLEQDLEALLQINSQLLSQNAMLEQQVTMRKQVSAQLRKSMSALVVPSNAASLAKTTLTHTDYQESLGIGPIQANQGGIQAIQRTLPRSATLEGGGEAFQEEEEKGGQRMAASRGDGHALNILLGQQSTMLEAQNMLEAQSLIDQDLPQIPPFPVDGDPAPNSASSSVVKVSTAALNEESEKEDELESISHDISQAADLLWNALCKIHSGDKVREYHENILQVVEEFPIHTRVAVLESIIDSF